MPKTDEKQNRNVEILLKNNIKKSGSILSNLYRIDDRAVKYKQAKQELMRMTNQYFMKHYEHQQNSRYLISSIEEQEWRRK